MVAQGLAEPPAKSCNCRKFIPYRNADKLVKNGGAKWVVVKRERGYQEAVCKMCQGDKDVVNCAACNGRGKVVVGVVWDTYNYDIVLVSQASLDSKEKKYRPALAMKTPRVATIESEHIERAYANEGPEAREAQARIEEYGHLIQIQLQELGAELRDRETGLEVFPGQPEPKNQTRGHAPGTITFKDGTTNKSWWWEVDGRDNDYGRAL